MPTGVFSRTTPGHGTVGLTVTDGRMTLFSAVPIDPEAIGRAEATLAGLFDVRGDWKTPGNPNATWRDLVARFGD